MSASSHSESLLRFDHSSHHQQHHESEERPPVPLHYTKSIDYRTDLQIQRDINLELYQQISKLKETNIRQGIELNKLLAAAEENRLLREVNILASKDIAYLRTEVSRYQQAADDNFSLRGRVLELQGELTIKNELTKHLNGKLARFESEIHTLTMEKQHYLDLHLKSQQELISLQRFEIEAKHRIQLLEIEFSRIQFVRDQSPADLAVQTTNDYMTLLNRFIQSTQQAQRENVQLTEMYEELVKSNNHNLSESRRLGSELERALNVVRNHEELEKKLLDLNTNELNWKNKLEEEYNRKFNEEIERITSSYRGIVEQKNTQLLSLMGMLELKKEAVSAEQRRSIEEVLKDLRP